MTTLSRRQFVGTAAAALAAMKLEADPLGLPIGCQTYPVRDQLSKDFPGTLKKLSSMGYRRIEMCSPQGYEKAGFGALVPMKPTEIRDAIKSAGLGCESSHYGMGELRDHFDERIAYAKDLGLKQMIIAYSGVREDAPMSAWGKAAEELNKFGEQVKKAGLQLGYHNHHFEFRKIDGVLVYDKLMEVLDPKLVKMQFQVSVISLGYKAADYLRKYPGRFISMHLQDWSQDEKKEAAVGKGVVDWKDTFAAAKIGGIKNYFVELPMEMLPDSYAYLHSLKV